MDKDIKELVEKGGEKTKPKKPLNARQERFAIEYVRTGNATQSALNANYKPHTAKERGYQLLKDKRISSLIEEEKAKIHKVLLKDRSVFLAEVEEMKQICREKGRVSEWTKLASLEASVLGIDKRDVSVQTTNIFNTMDSAKAFLNGFKGPVDEKPVQGMAEAEFVEPGQSSCNIEHTTQEGGEDKDTLHTQETASSCAILDNVHSENGGGDGV